MLPEAKQRLQIRMQCTDFLFSSILHFTMIHLGDFNETVLQSCCHSLCAVCWCHIYFLFSMNALCSLKQWYRHFPPPSRDLETEIFTRWIPTTTAAADLLADGEMKDTSVSFLGVCVCLDVGRGYHSVQGVGWTVRKRDLWIRVTQQATGKAW